MDTRDDLNQIGGAFHRGFIMLPQVALTLSPMALKLLCLYWRYERCWLSNRQIAEQLGCALNTMLKARAELEGRGWIKIESRHSTNGTPQTNIVFTQRDALWRDNEAHLATVDDSTNVQRAQGPTPPSAPTTNPPNAQGPTPPSAFADSPSSAVDPNAGRADAPAESAPIAGDGDAGGSSNFAGGGVVQNLNPIVQNLNPNNININKINKSVDGALRAPYAPPKKSRARGRSGDAEGEGARVDGARLSAMKTALARLFYQYDPDNPDTSITDSAWRFITRYARELCIAGATPGEMPALYGWCSARGWANFTVAALARHYPEWRRTQRPPSERPRIGDYEAAMIRGGVPPETLGITPQQWQDYLDSTERETQ